MNSLDLLLLATSLGGAYLARRGYLLYHAEAASHRSARRLLAEKNERLAILGRALGAAIVERDEAVADCEMFSELLLEEAARRRHPSTRHLSAVQA